MYISDLITALNTLQQVTGDCPISDIIVSDYDGIQFQTENMYYFYNYAEENIFKSTTPIITDDDITDFKEDFYTGYKFGNLLFKLELTSMLKKSALCNLIKAIFDFPKDKKIYLSRCLSSLFASSISLLSEEERGIYLSTNPL